LLALAVSACRFRPGDIILTSSVEHEALLRPIRVLRDSGLVRHVAVPYTDDGVVDPDAVAVHLRTGRVRLVACTMASNVTGQVVPVADLCAVAHQYAALCLVDAAQTAGVTAVDVPAIGADMVALAGHKGAQGPHGIGALYVAPAVALTGPVAAATAGACAIPAPLPSYCDIGSVNIAAAAGLAAGIEHVLERGIEVIARRIQTLAARLADGIAAHSGLRRVGAGGSLHTGIVSVVAGCSAGELGADLRARGIVTSAGRHCAPMAHRALGTGTGTVRLSVGATTTSADVDAALAALYAAVAD